MLRTAITFTIFISMILATKDYSELGVGSCSLKDVKLVQSFVENTVFDRSALKPHVYFNECEMEVSPSEDRHSYVTKVTLNNNVPCNLVFSTGHYDQDAIFHTDDKAAELMIKKCKIDFFRSRRGSKNRIASDQETDYEGLPDLFAEPTDEFEGLADLFKDETTGEINRESIDQLIVDPNYQSLSKVFQDKNTGEVDYEGIVDLFNQSEETQVVNYEHGTSADQEEETGLPGGFHSCDANTRMDFFNLLINLGNKRVFKPIFIYEENLKECHTQVVNGINYDALLSINGAQCHVQVYAGFDGTVELTNSVALMAHDQCSTYLTYEYATMMKSRLEEQ